MSTSEHVTVLFTDLVSSTELASSLTPEEADEVRRAHFSALRQAIAASGGVEVKNLGDGLMVVFRAASAALDCAVAMQQAVERDNRDRTGDLGLRVGLSAGEATKEHDDYFGEPVIEAARICAKAGGGQILVSDVVRLSAGRRSSHRFSSLGEIELKGLPAPIETLEVAWEPLGTEALKTGLVPLPPRLAHRPGVGVIGRALELESLEAAAKRVATGEGREVILISAEPGQGKTTLAAEVARRCHERGMVVLLGHCEEEVSAPYRLFTEALSHFVSHAEEALLEAHVARHGGELVRIVPALRQRLGEVPPGQGADPDTEMYMLFAAAVGLLEAAAAECPVVLLLDDLHWADKPSLRLLRHLVANSAASRLLILGTYRGAELSGPHPLTETLAALEREPTGISRIELKGLDDTGVLAFMESAAGHQLDDPGIRLARDLYRETDGNPFFVGEVLRNLAETGAIILDPATGRWTTADNRGHLALPHSLRAVIGARVSRLGDQAARVLATASVIGRDFDLDVLAETTKVDEDELIDLLEDAQGAAVVREVPGSPGHYLFSHALIQHTLYEDIGETRRARVHRSVGEAIEHLYGSATDEHVAELARHFLLATRPTDADKAISYARRAGEAALVGLAPDDAVSYFSQALELASLSTTLDPASRIDLLIGLGTAQRQAGTPDFRATLLEAGRRARQEADAGRLAAAALANTRGFFSVLGRLDDEKVEILEAALAALPQADSADRARLLATLCSELLYDSTLERRVDLAEEAKAIARRLGDAEALVDVIHQCAVAVQAPSTLDWQLADIAEAVETAKRSDYLSYNVTNQAYIVAVRAGQFEVAEERLAEMKDIAERLRQPVGIWVATYSSAAAALLHGDATAAEQLATQALEIGSACGQPDALSFFGVQLMGTRRMQGRYGELVPLITDVVKQYPTIPTFKAVLACACLDGGDEAAARDIYHEGAGASFSLPQDQSWLDGIIRYARVATELQLVDHAETLAELLSPFHGQVPYTGLTPSEPVALSLAGLMTLLGRYDEAEAYFAEAAELNTRGAMVYSEANTNRLWGRMLRQRGGAGDAERARHLLEGARSTAAERGYALVQQAAAAELEGLSST